MRADEHDSRAREIHFSSLVFDTHADTPQRLFFDRFDLGRRDAEGCVDIPRLREGGVGAIFFALWVPVEITGAAATQRVRDLLEATLRQIEIHGGDLALCTSSKEVGRRERKTKSQFCWEWKAGTPSTTTSRFCASFTGAACAT